MKRIAIMLSCVAWLLGAAATAEAGTIFVDESHTSGANIIFTGATGDLSGCDGFENCNPMYIFAPSGSNSAVFHSALGNMTAPFTGFAVGSVNLTEPEGNVSDIINWATTWINTNDNVVAIGWYSLDNFSGGCTPDATTACIAETGLPQNIFTVDYYSGTNGSGSILRTDTFIFQSETPTSVPEPLSTALFGAGLVALVASSRRKRK